MVVDAPRVDPEPAGPPIVIASSPSRAVEDRVSALHELLDRPDPHRVFLISAENGPADFTETAALLEISSHRNFYQLDPSGADGGNGPSASVFVAELDPNELATLRNRLSGAFAGRLDEIEVDRRLLAELANGRRVTALRAAPAGEILFPRNQMALQSAAVAGPSPALGGEPEPAERASRPVASSTVETGSRRDDRASIVLLWFIDPAAP